MQAVKQAKTWSRKRSAAALVSAAADPVSPQKVQAAWGMKTDAFARLTGFSPRKIAQLKAGAKMSAATRQRIAELDRLQAELAKVIKADALARWMDTPNKSFGGLKPLEVVERGETDRLWRMCYQLASGEPG
jgi:uncharacterized protein (DUF2384 family)